LWTVVDCGIIELVACEAVGKSIARGTAWVVAVFVWRIIPDWSFRGSGEDGGCDGKGEERRPVGDYILCQLIQPISV